MFNYGKASAKPFGVPRTESAHRWSKSHKSKSKSNYKFKSYNKTIFNKQKWGMVP